MGWISPHHSTNFLDKISLSLGLQEPVYTVVIDAGSTGSRVLAFTFHRSLSGIILHLCGNDLYVILTCFYQIAASSWTKNFTHISNQGCRPLPTTRRKEPTLLNNCLIKQNTSSHPTYGIRYLLSNK